MEDLFTTAKRRIIDKNSVDSFYSKDVQLKRGTQKFVIYECLKQHGILSQREISAITGIPRYLVPDRLKALIKSGHVELAGEKLDALTNHNVYTYKIKGDRK